MVSSGVGRVQGARVEEARAVVVDAISGWAAGVPFRDLGKGLAGQEGDAVHLTGVIGPDDGVAGAHADAAREVPHDRRGVEGDVTAGGRADAIVRDGPGGDVDEP